MNRILVIILFFNLFSFIGYAQKSTNQLEKFNIGDFEKKSQKNGSYYFKLTNGNFVQQVGNKESGYYERIEEKSSPYGYYKEFFPIGNLKTRGPTFYGRMIGVHNYYNIDGVLINIIDFQKGFSFTINSLVKKVDSLYHVNLLDTTQIYSVVLSYNKPTPIYYITIRIPAQGKDTRDIEINGINGQVLSDEITKRYIKETE